MSVEVIKDLAITISEEHPLFAHATRVVALLQAIGITCAYRSIKAGDLDLERKVAKHAQVVIALMSKETIALREKQLAANKVKKDVVKSKRVKASRPKRVLRNTKGRR